MTFETKDSGKRESYDSGMVRDTQDGKPRFDLLIPYGVPFRAQFFTRVAELLARGAEKYSDRNWENASGSEELDRFKSSAYRHLMQWFCDESDEDHAAAVVFNLLAYETTKWKMSQDEEGDPWPCGDCGYPDNPSTADWCINCHDDMNEDDEPVQVSNTDSSRSEDSSGGDSHQCSCIWDDGCRQKGCCPTCRNL